MYSQKLLIGISCLMMTASLTSISSAATQTGKLQIHLSIDRSCKLDAADVNLDFGTLSTLEKEKKINTDEGKGIKVTCSQDLPFTIGLDYGTNHSGSAEDGERYMGNGSSYLRYSLYKQDGGFWGDGTGAIADLLSSTGTGKEENYSVTGIAFKKVGAIASGNYTDTVNIIVSY